MIFCSEFCLSIGEYFPFENSNDFIFVNIYSCKQTIA